MSPRRPVRADARVAPSFAGEGRGPLLAERLDALAEVVRRAQQAVGEPLDLEADVQRPVVGGLSTRFAMRSASGERCASSAISASTAAVELVRRDDLGDEAERERLVGADRGGRA